MLIAGALMAEPFWFALQYPINLQLLSFCLRMELIIKLHATMDGLH